MRATLLSIITNPLVYSKLQYEIDAAVHTELISSPITGAEASKLPYLQACILEGLRRYPPIAQLREREVPPEGDMINGHHIPGGTFIGLNSWGLQLNSVFGDDPEVFRPERWLIEDQVQLKRMHRVHELIFGHGSTKCMGVPIAMLGLNKIFVEVCSYYCQHLSSNGGQIRELIVLQLLRQFDLSIINPERPWRTTGYGIFFQKDFNIRVQRRQRT
jgi:cytochrome P450